MKTKRTLILGKRLPIKKNLQSNKRNLNKITGKPKDKFK